MRFLALLFVPLAFAAICPMDHHQACNEQSTDLKCMCSVTQLEESPVKHVSCNKKIARDPETNEFPVVSIEFNLDKSNDGLEEWPEEAFRDKISSSLRVDEDDILILRAGCTGTDDSLTVQFVVLKKETNASATPFEIEDLRDAKSIATRMKAMGHLSQIANLDVDTIEYTEELIDLEYDPSNVKLFIQATLIGIVFGVFFVMGIYRLFRREDDYSDDLQKA